MGRGARLQRLLQQADRGDPVAIGIVALVVGLFALRAWLALRRRTRRDPAGDQGDRSV